MHLNTLANIIIDISSVTAKEINAPIVINTDFINFTFSTKVRANNVGSEQIRTFSIVLEIFPKVDMKIPSDISIKLIIICLFECFLFSDTEPKNRYKIYSHSYLYYRTNPHYYKFMHELHFLPNLV